MSRFSVGDSYRQLWMGSPDPKLVHVIQRDKEASLHPRVLHSHDAFSEVLLILEGECSFFISGRLWKVKAGDLVFFNAGIAHDQRTNPGQALVNYTVAVTGFQYNNCRPNCLLPDEVDPVVPTGESFPQLKSMFQLIYRRLENYEVGSDQIAHYLTQALLAEIKALVAKQEAEIPGERNEIPLATRVRAYLDENFCEDINLQGLATRFNISSYYLAHIFKDQFGYPPLQYILRRRIGLAQTLLITTDLPVGEIGARVGYANPSHFNMIFTKNVGISPRRYRLNYLS